jgi:peptidoglycan/LPS O-acetylase OafA/YrhL
LVEAIRVLRPGWLPQSIPELNGIRGLAVLSVVLYHCKESLSGTPLYPVAQWGWTGVELFFVLSGFLITGIILESRTEPLFFRGFYWRRLLRIWPMYVLLLAVVFALNSSWRPRASGVHWFYYALLLQNLTRVTLPGPLVPTWSLAIEEQYYLLWAPLARWIRSWGAILLLLVALLAASPVARASHLHTLSTTNTLFHLDGIAFGSLTAFLLYTLALSRRAWRIASVAVTILGLGLTVYYGWGGSPFTDTALALLFAGLLLAAVSWTGESFLYARALRLALLTFFGRVSYGLYMTHMLVFILIGAIDGRLARFGTVGGVAVVLIRLLVSTAVATSLWYGFEQPILKLKHLYRGGTSGVRPTGESEVPVAAGFSGGAV